MDNFHLQSFLPAWNATLNAFSLICLVAGLIAVKQGHNETHKKWMLGAMAFSTLFLASYLYYHFHFPSRPFQGQGLVRTLYFTMLISHIILAVLMLPFIFRLLYLGFKNRPLEHKKLGRYVWPVWTYVSATGVLIYLFLYQWFPGDIT